MLETDFAFTISIPIYIVFLIVWLKYKTRPLTILFLTLFYFYVVAVIGVTLFPLPIDKLYIEGSIDSHSLDINNYIPFTFLSDTILQLTPVANDTFGYDFRVKMVLRQVGGNILLGAPFGFLFPLIWKKRNTFRKVFVAGFYFSFGIEASQFLISRIVGYNYRLTDVDDIILNCTGVALGYLCYKIAVRIFEFLSLKVKGRKEFT